MRREIAAHSRPRKEATVAGAEGGKVRGASSEGEMAEASWPVQSVGKKKGCELERAGAGRGAGSYSRNAQ